MTGLCLLLAANTFATTIEDAFSLVEAGAYAEAADRLDASAAVDPDQFQLNNLDYLRGRIAEAQGDWEAADEAFGRVQETSVLHELAVAHRAGAALRRNLTGEARALIARLPDSFPAAVRMELADLSPPSVALDIYDAIDTRSARWRRAAILDDETAMWRLLERSQNDEIALEAAGRLERPDLTAGQRMRLAETFHNHRVFDRAEALYRSLLDDQVHGGKAHYQLGRTYFQRMRYDDAIGVFRATIMGFPGTDWAEDAEGQIATAYWRQMDYATAAAAYTALIEARRGDRARYHSAVRDLVDIHRASGSNDQALAWIETALRNRPSGTDRAVLIFTRAKIHFGDGRFGQALEDFQQLERMNLRSVPNGTDRSEIRFFQALCLERLGRVEEARSIWSELARQPFDYYGLKAIEKLGDLETWGFALQQTVQATMNGAPAESCLRGTEQSARDAARARRLERSRGVRIAPGEADLVGELVFLRLWDEAFFWAEVSANRWRDDALADLAFLASDFRRAMIYADRLRPADERRLFTPEGGDADGDSARRAHDLLAMLYPTGFGEILCRESESAGSNPLWLQAIIWQESRYDPRARSGAAARGLMQFIPETAAEMSARLGISDLSPDALYQPEVSIRLGAHYWAALIGEIERPEKALAAYNGGLGNVLRWAAKSGGDPELFVADIGFVETKSYVRRVFELYAKYAFLSSTSKIESDTLESAAVD